MNLYRSNTLSLVSENGPSGAKILVTVPEASFDIRFSLMTMEPPMKYVVAFLYGERLIDENGHFVISTTGTYERTTP